MRDGLREWILAVNETVWGAPMLLLMLAAGLVLTLRSGGVQLRRLGLSIRTVLGDLFRKRRAGAGEVTPLQSVTSALAATVGTGNITGVTVALAAGGPGALFWMWAAALLGMATKYAEVALAVRWRRRNRRGDRVGGPMYYMAAAGTPGMKALAVVFACFGALAAFGVGNAVQAGCITQAVNGALAAFLPGFTPTAAVGRLVGLAAAAAAGLTLLGGVKRLGRVTEKLIPFLAAAYILACLAVLLRRAWAVPAALGRIFHGAFSPAAVTGGGVGTLMAALSAGVRSGVFSNEAGMGSAPIAYAASAEPEPVRQGLYGVFEVFLDTIVLCTLTGLTLLVSGVPIPYGQTATAAVNAAALATVFGERLGALLIAAGTALFALATILSWSLYGQRCWEFLLGEGAGRVYQGLYVAVCFFGASLEPGLSWTLAETLNGLMAVPNLAALLALSGQVREMTRAYFQKSRWKAAAGSDIIAENRNRGG